MPPPVQIARRRRKRRRPRRRKFYKKRRRDVRHVPRAVQFGGLGNIQPLFPNDLAFPERRAPVPEKIPDLFTEGSNDPVSPKHVPPMPRAHTSQTPPDQNHEEMMTAKEAAHQAMIEYKYAEMMSSPEEMVKNAFDSTKKPDKSHLRTPTKFPVVAYRDEHADQVANGGSVPDIEKYPGATNEERKHIQAFRVNRAQDDLATETALVKAKINFLSANGKDTSQAEAELKELTRVLEAKVDAEAAKFDALSRLAAQVPHAIQTPMTAADRAAWLAKSPDAEDEFLGHFWEMDRSDWKDPPREEESTLRRRGS
ncbi:MAG: uncharacterized protein KVP18_000044 [Porospora cf. gigantea A]|uniref:uncharacterized protein n=1 Tax=Porospora cf. gigantea A TaxID=2853593 RepID=UPI003559E07E|nr:MAG: hypothetical protein KVP18_000044 [Porospora cf. gigantea A]